MTPNAGIAQLVEHNLAKVGVASSSLVSRSNGSQKNPDRFGVLLFSLILRITTTWFFGWVAEWLCSGLQSRVRRFDSDPSLPPNRKRLTS